MRKRSLPTGWYPDNSQEIYTMLESWKKKWGDYHSEACAGIVPHAGWMFSGEIAAFIMHCIDKNIETLVIVGGHLPAGAGILAAFEEEYETPLGLLQGDASFLYELRKKITIQEDLFQDNTVEIQLPLVKAVFPNIAIVWLRVEQTGNAVKLGKTLYEVALKLNRRIGVLGSTDLTHYGRNYGFAPKGRGENAVSWVKNTNDKRFIDALTELRIEDALNLAVSEKSACSAGGAAAAAAFSVENGVTKGTLEVYRTSYDIYPDESFVGYAGIAYYKE